MSCVFNTFASLWIIFFFFILQHFFFSLSLALAPVQIECRLFSSRRCARCGTGLSSSELVMRARDLVFHVGCFCCILCGIHLSAGDTAAVRGGRVFCSEHYDADVLRYMFISFIVCNVWQFYLVFSSLSLFFLHFFLCIFSTSQSVFVLLIVSFFCF